jgi:putative transposase
MRFVTIVHPGTLLRWIRGGPQGQAGEAHQGWPPPDRRVDPHAHLRLAKENNWGYTRILGELRKLNIKSISRNTVKDGMAERAPHLRPGTGGRRRE